MSACKIQIRDISKSFGEQKVLNNLSLQLWSGKIYGIVGRNGSGKTVLMKCICGLLKVDSGTILVDGKEIFENEELVSQFGVIIDSPGFFPNYSARKNLWLLSRIRNVCGRQRVREVLEMVGLDPDSPKKVSCYSLGMCQRLGIAQAIMEYPEILILDEPMNGLDNQGVADMRKVFLKLRDEGKLILLASHNREDIDILCDEVFEMDAGNIIHIEAERRVEEI